MNRHIASLLRFCSLCSVFVIACAAGAGEIALRSAVRLPADAKVVRLADVAELTGDAARLGDVVLAELQSADALEIPLHVVRAKLTDAGAHWGRINLSGRSVVVRPRRSGVSPPLAMTPASIAADAPTERRPRREEPIVHGAAELVNSPTLRGEIARFIARGLDISPSDLRLKFDEREHETLDSVNHRMRFEIEPASGLRSGRIDLGVRVWMDGRVAERRTISVTPSVRAATLVLLRDIERGAVVREADVEAAMQWLTPAQHGLLADPAVIAGRQAATRLREGETLREQHLRRETIVRRGEQVIVRCLVGGAVISLQVEARSDGALGETIEFRKPGERDTFLATVTGRGEAIVDLSR